MHLFKHTAACAVALALTGTAALAQSPLAPGDTDNPVPTIAGVTGTLFVSSTVPFAATGIGTAISGTVTSAVYDRGGGLRDFWYQVVTDPTGPTSNATVTAINIASFIMNSTDVAQAAGPTPAVFAAGTEPASSAVRGADGAGVQFNFFAAPGSTTFQFLIRTDATNQTLGSAGIIGGGTAATVDVFAPSVAGATAPEPPAALLTLAALPLAGLVARRRVMGSPTA